MLGTQSRDQINRKICVRLRHLELAWDGAAVVPRRVLYENWRLLLHVLPRIVWNGNALELVAGWTFGRKFGTGEWIGQQNAWQRRTGTRRETHWTHKARGRHRQGTGKAAAAEKISSSTATATRNNNQTDQGKYLYQKILKTRKWITLPNEELNSCVVVNFFFISFYVI